METYNLKLVQCQTGGDGKKKKSKLWVFKTQRHRWQKQKAQPKHHTK